MPKSTKDATRRRTIRACIPCQSAKRRCSSELPCSYCIKRGSTSFCTYANDRKSADSDRPSPNQSQPILLGISTPRHETATTSIQEPNVLRPTSATDDREETQISNQESSAGDSPNTVGSVKPRLLRNSRGNAVYVGNTAVIAFLPLLRDIFRHHAGPSRFTDVASRNTMLETDLRAVRAVECQDQINITQKRELIRLFFIATSGILDILEESEIVRTVEAIEAGHSMEGSNYAVSNLVVAIGARCHPESRVYANCERVHLDRSRMTWNVELLENVSLDSVHVCLLAAFYMLCVCRRDTAYMYLGVAARAAHAMGLHHDEYFDSLTGKDNQNRLQTWKSLRVLDSLVSSFLGRPSACSRQRNIHGIFTPSSGDTKPPRILALDAGYRLLKVTDHIVDVLHQQQIPDANMARRLLEELTSWSVSLHPTLRSGSPQKLPESMNPELMIGNMHVACSYYFGVMLVTRPFLLHHLKVTPSEQTTTAGARIHSLQSATVPSDGPEIAELAKGCENAAVFMLEACHNILQAGLILSNMCLLQAWNFAAALNLGLVMFMEDEPNAEVRRAYKGAIAVLEKLSKRSPQSALYHEILTDLLQEVDKRQKQAAARKRESSTRLVNRILRLDSLTESDTVNTARSNPLFELNDEIQLQDIASVFDSGTAPFGWDNLGWDSFGLDDLVFQSWDDCHSLGEYREQ